MARSLPWKWRRSIRAWPARGSICAARLLLFLFLFLLFLFLVFVLNSPSQTQSHVRDVGISSRVRRLVQVSKRKPSALYIRGLRARAPGWTYHHYNDNQCMALLDASSRALWDQLPTGQHRSDLCRYIVLEQDGGMFLDTDVTLEADIDTIVGNVSFVSARTYHYNKHALFNGFLYATSHHPLMQIVLADALKTDIQLLRDDYHHWIKMLYLHMIDANLSSTRILYERKSFWWRSGSRILDEHAGIVASHWAYNKAGAVQGVDGTPSVIERTWWFLAIRIASNVRDWTKVRAVIVQLLWRDHII